MKEYLKIRQEEIGFRRLFTDEVLDLYVWYNAPGGEIQGFQLVEKFHSENDKAFTWNKEKGAHYTSILQKGRNNAAPLLVINGALEKERLLKVFKGRAQEVPSEISSLVAQSLDQFVLT